jgi:hypothetical protein
MPAPPQVIELVERFTRNLDAYKRPEYKEAHVRVEFIDPFFEALGWDVRNVQGHAEAYKDVVHEDALKTGGGTRAPDYCFRVGGVRKFFLEAKKPSVSVRGDVGPAYQLRRYTWTAKLPLGILTDFEEFAVYECRQRPVPSEGPAVGRVMVLTFDQYPDRFDDIYTTNFDDPTDVARHDKMVALVERMLELHRKLAAAAIRSDRRLYQRQIEAADRQIDALVYELYGLTEEEITIVEK